MTDSQTTSGEEKMTEHTNAELARFLDFEIKRIIEPTDEQDKASYRQLVRRMRRAEHRLRADADTIESLKQAFCWLYKFSEGENFCQDFFKSLVKIFKNKDFGGEAA